MVYKGIKFKVTSVKHANVILTMLKQSGFLVKEYHNGNKVMEKGGCIYARCVNGNEDMYVCYQPNFPGEFVSVSGRAAQDTDAWNAIFNPKEVLPEITINTEQGTFIGDFCAEGKEVRFGCATVTRGKLEAIVSRMGYLASRWKNQY